jgi:Transglycosylase SLT domain
MRHPFLPACFCLATLPNPTSFDSGVSLEQLFGANALARVVEAPASASDQGNNENVGPTIAEPAADTSADAPAIKPPIPPPAVRPTPKPVIARSHQEICDTLVEAAQSNDLPVPFFIHLLFQESRFKPDAVSRAGAQGIAQFMPETAADVGLDNPFDSLQAIAASARLLRDRGIRSGSTFETKTGQRTGQEAGRGFFRAHRRAEQRRHPTRRGQQEDAQKAATVAAVMPCNSAFSSQINNLSKPAFMTVGDAC